ncbi:leucine-rich repeat domain-containing protein [Mangrovivirga cuniculi]|uniref:Disease resistance R13L4/SHOC-2-like LRR domain-containing protein n=1 Tax=Mangrovivirga cuniculi TaxID=2715131 RepID=A0A4D7JN38_9BACT|nr:leucine-rich repeat domain-containing protein [Mangrovivirga cuniculi]QCK16233.1 hypothetical protein DCC35_16535 [Mangrovivirga cuniculi]
MYLFNRKKILLFFALIIIQASLTGCKNDNTDRNNKILHVSDLPEDKYDEYGWLKKEKYPINFNISGNSLSVIQPSHSKRLSDTKYLNISRNNIRDISQLTELESLEVLNASKNEINSLPPSISNMTNLSELNISFNHLTFIPSNIGNLQKLRNLKIRNNFIEELSGIENGNIDTLIADFNHIKKYHLLSLIKVILVFSP